MKEKSSNKPAPLQTEAQLRASINEAQAIWLEKVELRRRASTAESHAKKRLMRATSDFIDRFVITKTPSKNLKAHYAR